MKKILLVLISFILVNPAVWAAYREPENLDREYELDLITQSYPRNWDKYWRGRDQAWRISGGSVNVRDLLLRQEVKFKLLLSSRWNLGGNLNFYQTIPSSEISCFTFDRPDAFDQTNYKNVFAFEYKLQGKSFLSIMGAPALEKKRIDAGVGWRLAQDQLNYLSLRYWWLNFDNNHAFSKEKEFDDKEEIYSRNPREIDLSLGVKQLNFYGYLEFTVTTKARQEFIFYNDPAAFYRAATGSIYFNSLCEYQFNQTLLLGAEIFRETGHRDQEFLVEQDNFDSYFSKYFVSPYATFQLDQSNALTLELRWQQKRFVQNFPQQETANFKYHKREIFPLITYARKLNNSWDLELGYLREAAKVRRVYPNQPTLDNFKDSLIDDRLKIAFIYKVGEKLFLKALTGVELDSRDQGKFPYLDKGAVQLISNF